jgi:hypothetical protein
VYIGSSKIQTIEVNAFQNLVKLRWISLTSNKIESLPFQIFKSNPELIYINLQSNKISAISSDFFRNLKKLKYLQLTGGNLCINKDYGCSSCSVSQADLDVALATCYSNCKNNMDCALKSGKFDILNLRFVEENMDDIVAYGHLDVLIKMNYTDLLIEKGHLNLMVENGLLDSLVAQNYLDPLIQNGHLDLLIQKNYTDLLIKNGYKNKIIENDWNLKFAYTDINKNTDEVKNAMKKDDFVKSEATVLHAVSQNSNEIKRIEKKFEEISAMFGSDLKIQQDKVGLLEKTVANFENLEEEGNSFDQSNRIVRKFEGQSLKISENPVKCQALSDNTKEEIKELNQMLLLQVSEAKLLMENERLKFKLNEAKCANDKVATDFELKTLKQDLADLKKESDRRDAEMKALKDIVDQFEMSSRP